MLPLRTANDSLTPINDSPTLPPTHFTYPLHHPLHHRSLPSLDVPQPALQSTTSLPRALLYTIPESSVSSLSLAVRSSQAPPTRLIIGPLPFTSQPLLLREVREEYRQYFRLPPRNSGENTKDDARSWKDEIFDLPVLEESKKGKKGIVKRACHSLKKVRFIT